MIIGIDHGYGFIKTKNTIFASGVAKMTTQPPISSGVLSYNGSYYQVGVSPDGIAADKTENEDYFVLTLAAIAEEMRRYGMLTCDVTLAVGLPLTRYGIEKDKFVAYLRKDGPVEFMYEDKSYSVSIDSNILVYPQGYSAIIGKLPSIKGTSFLVDIGTGTTEILPIAGDHRIDLKRAFTVQWGISDCIARINEAISREFQTVLSTDQILDVMLARDIVIPERVRNVVTSELSAFCADTFSMLRQKKVTYEITQTFILGGGAGLLKRYSEKKPEMVTYITDIRANAIGYEALARARAEKNK